MPNEYTFLTSLLWCNFIIIICSLLKRKRDFQFKHGVTPLFLLMLLGLCRLVVNYEPPFIKVVPSRVILPSYLDFVRKKISFGSFTLNLVAILIISWASVSFFLLLRIVIKQIMLNKRISTLKTVYDARAIKAINKIVLETKPKQKYRLLVSDEIKSPMITGMFVPTILLPILFLSDDELEYVIRHEWNHFCHKDLWIKLLVSIICVILWWNPFVYILRKDLNMVLEINSDLKITKGLNETERLKYLASTINVIRQTRLEKIALPDVALGFASDLADEKLIHRFNMVLANPPKKSKLTMVILSTVVTITLLFSYSFVLQPGADPVDFPGRVTVTPENAYIKAYNNGVYILIVDGDK